MVLRQVLRSEPVAASNLFGCGGKSAGAVGDPADGVAPCLKVDLASRMQIRDVIDPHLHADHVSPGHDLARAAGATFPFKGVRLGEELGLGKVLIQVLHMPGRRPEQVSLPATDRTHSPGPWFEPAGPTPMAGDLGRTDLGTSAGEGATALFRSVQALEAHR